MLTCFSSLQGNRFVVPIRVVSSVLMLLCVALLGRTSCAQSLANKVLVVYNSGNSASVSVANYYVAQRGIPVTNLCPIAPPSTTSLTWSQYVSTVKTPVRNCLQTLGPNNILYIVFTYQTPYTVTGSSGPLGYSLDQYVADIWDLYSTTDFYPYPTKTHPYYDDAQSEGNVYQPFVSLATFRAGVTGVRIYSVWRLDGATQALAQGLVDKAIAAENSGLSGQACIDRRSGAMSSILDSDYGEGEWDLHQAATFLSQAGFTVIEDSNSAEFGTPPAPNCPNAALYSGWYSLNHYNNAFTWNTGAIGFHLDSLSAPNPRGGTNWSANAIINGITVTSGAVAEPYLQGLLRPGGMYRDLLQGANVGDAFLRNTRWLKWMILYLGDPLYRPFPHGLAPFNPPPPQYSLSLSPRYVINGTSSVGIVTLQNPAPVGGTVVSLSSSKPTLVQVPASVTVPQGLRSAIFSATAVASPYVTTDTPALITASGVGQNALTVTPLIGSVFITPSVMLGGASASGLVTINANAPSGGSTIALHASSPYTTVPATVTVPQGATQAGFTINSSAVASNTSSNITASVNNATAGSSITLYPGLQSVSASPTLAPGGAAANLIIYLPTNAPSGGWPVNLNSSAPSVATAPSVVTVPAGTRYLQVPITSTPQCSNTLVTFTATGGVTSLNTNFTVTPPPPSSLSFVNIIRGGQNVTATVTLSNPACSAGQPVSLSSNNTSVATVPPSMTVPAGQTTATFTITTYVVTGNTTVTISATSDNVTKSKTLTVTP